MVTDRRPSDANRRDRRGAFFVADAGNLSGDSDGAGSANPETDSPPPSLSSSLHEDGEAMKARKRGLTLNLQ